MHWADLPCGSMSLCARACDPKVRAGQFALQEQAHLCTPASALHGGGSRASGSLAAKWLTAWWCMPTCTHWAA